VILDEAHYLTLNNEGFFTKNKIHSLIIMTATLPDEPDKKRLLNKLSRGHSLTITLDMAVKSNVLNDYRIRVWEIEMTAMEKSGYMEICRKMQHLRDKGIFDMLNIVGGKRKQYIADLQTKYKAAVYLADQIRQTKKRFVIFCGSIEMANRMSRYTYHSGVDSDHYQAFCSGHISEIACVKQIQEGANIVNLESALITQVDSKQLNLIQKLGRLLRLTDGKVARLHILVVKNSCDQDWLTKSLKSIDKSKVSYHPLDRDLYDKP
jgi:superfamily II DNA or RNA helicase